MKNYILNRLAEEGSGSERDLSTIGSDPYKPFYRALAIILGWNKEDPQGHPMAEACGGRKPTMEETREMLKECHPWFKHALETEPEYFESHYRFIYDAWD